MKPPNPPEKGDAPDPHSKDLEGVLAEMRRGATAWPSAHREVFEQAVDKLREAIEEVQVTEEELRRQNDELAAAQLEAVIARERYAELFNFAPVAHLVTDLHGNILEANLKAAALLGVAQEDLFRKPLSAFIPPGERRSFRNRLTQIAGEGQVHDWNFRLKPRDEPPFDAAATLAVFRDADGKRAELRWVLHDVTERVAAEHEVGHDLELYREAVQSAGDLITVLDEDGKIELASSSWVSMLGYEPRAVMGRSVFDFIHPDDLPALHGVVRRIADTGEGSVLRVRWLHRAGHAVDLEISGTVAGRDEHGPLRIVTTARDVTERQRLEQEAHTASVRYRKLQGVTDVLLRHMDLDDLLPDLLEAVRQAVGSDTATLLLPTADGKNLAIRAAVGEEEGVVGEIRVPIGKGVAGKIAAERTPRIAPDLRKARPYSEFLRRKLHSLVGVPLIIGSDAVGVVHCGTFQHHEFTEEDVTLLELVAERAAVAIENTRLYEVAQEAKEVAERAANQTSALQSVTAALSEALTTDQVATVVVERAVDAVGATAGLMALVTADGSALEIARATGYPDSLLSTWRRFPIDGHLPLSDAVRSGRPVLLESTRARQEQYPGLQTTLNLGDHALAAIPVSIEGRRLGGLVFRFEQPGPFTESAVEFMQAMGRQAALALERARLYEAEQDARNQAEVAQVRLAFLAEASAIMSRSLQMPEALESLGRLAVTFLTDLCLIDVLDEDGSVRRVVSVHADAEKQPLADLLRTEYAPDPAGSHPVMRVMRTGRSEFQREMPEEFLRRTTRDEEHLRIVLELGFQSYMCVPVLSRGRVLGCFTLVSTNPERRYGAADVELAEELARRAALAVDNALLFQGEYEARHAAERAADRVAFLAEASEVLSSSLDHEILLQRVASLAVPRLADWCIVDLLGDDGSMQQLAVAHRDPSKEPLIRELRRHFPPERMHPHPVWKVLDTGEPLLAEVVTDEELAARARDARHLSLLRQLTIRSHIVVPMTARGRIIGALSFITGDSDRRYGLDDLLLAEDLGRRAGVAVDNSRLYRGELTARQEAEHAQARLEFLSEATASLSAAVPDYEATLERVANLAVPALADLCVIDVVEENGSIHRIAVAHGGSKQERLAEDLRRFPPDPVRPGPFQTVLRSGQPFLASEVTADTMQQVAKDQEHLALLQSTGATGLMILPLSARQRTLGTLGLVATGERKPFGPEDVTLAEELARRAALVVDNARLYERQLHIARTLQRSLLPPSIPLIPGAELSARYRAAGEGTEVGGDFYDAFETADGAWIIAIGDVCGKGPEAAAVTGLARHTIRAVSLHEPRPSRVLATLNEAILRELSDERFCTVCCLRLRTGGGGARVTVCSGGHPLPLILRADGTIETAGKPGMLLGILPDVELSDQAADLGRGDAIVMFTDGVVEEARGSSLAGPERLHGVLARCRGLSAAAIADAVEASVTSSGAEPARDDFAILVLRVAPDGATTGEEDAG